jgi:uncharacterized membrane protein YccF (DUF307 family)
LELMQCKGEVSMSQHYPQQPYHQQPMYQQPFQGQQYPQQYGPEQPLSSYPLDGPGQLFQQPAPPRMQPWPQQPMSLPPGYQQPMLYQQQQYAASPMMSTNVNVQVGSNGPGMLVRILYFLFVGWWVGLFWLNIGFALCALIVTLPLGLIMLNRLPQVMTLKPASQRTSVNVSTVAMQPGGGPIQQHINISVNDVQQYNFFLRALYYIFIGWWVGYLWAVLAYLCCCTLVLLPVGVMMFDRLPMVLTLRKN